jgi:glycosyltransferase involved in cell wall biosynthesis
VHESPRHFAIPGRVDLDSALDAMRRHDYCVFVSERGQREWQALAQLDPQRSLHIPNCVQEQRVLAVLGGTRAHWRERLGYGANRLRVVCVGQVTPRKGQDLVLAALERLPAAAPALDVDFIGECGSAWARDLARRSAALPLAKHVRFLGAVNDVYERVFAADLLVVGSRAEAFPLVVLEAMALGTCVVAADVDGVGEQVIDAQTGLLFAPEDAGQLAQALARAASDARLRERLAAAGRARYLERFTRDRQLALWNAALSQMLPG